MHNWEHFPKSLIVIGHNGCGDLLVLKAMNDDPATLKEAFGNNFGILT